MKQWPFILMAAALILASVAGCVPPSAPASTSIAEPSAPPAAVSEKPKLKVWFLNHITDDQTKWLEDKFLEYGKANNVDLELHHESGETYFQKLTVLQETGDLPDVWMTFEAYMPGYRKAGLIADLSDVVAQLKTRDGGLVEPFVDGITWEDGKQWGLGYEYWADAWYVRKDLVEAKGLKLPETYEDVARVAKAIADPKAPLCGWGMTLSLVEGDPNFEAHSLLWAFGAKVWGEDGKTIALKSPETQKAIQFLKDAWDAGAMCEDALSWADSGGNNKCYLSGSCAIVQNGGSIARALKKDYPELLAKTAIIPGPAGPAGRANVTNFEPWVISAKSAVPDEAKKFLLWWYEPQNQLEYMQQGLGSRFPIYKDHRSDPVWQDPLLQPFLENSQYSHPVWWPGVRTPWSIGVENDHTLTRMFTRVLVEGWDIDKSIDQAVEDLKKLQEQYK